MKTGQITQIRSAVKTSITESVKSGLKSYSAALNVSDGGVQLSQADLKSVVKGAITESSQDEDRASNVMLWGLPEENGEKLDKKVADVFEKPGEKPRLTSVRVGKKVDGGSNRPVRVNLGGSAAVKQILAKSRNLKTVDQYKTVFVSTEDQSRRRRSTDCSLLKLSVTRHNKSNLRLFRKPHNFIMLHRVTIF